MNCPKCFEPLRIAERQGVEIDYCPDCRGIWLDRGELDKIIERTSESDYRGSAPPAYREYEERKGYPKYKDSGKYKSSHNDHYYKKHNKKYYKKKHILKEIMDIFD